MSQLPLECWQTGTLYAHAQLALGGNKSLDGGCLFISIGRKETRARRMLTRGENLCSQHDELCRETLTKQAKLLAYTAPLVPHTALMLAMPCDC